METKHIFIGNYVNRTAKDRIGFIIENYSDFEGYRHSYMENVINIMIAIREYERRKPDDELGICVQVSGHTSDITASRALERVSLQKCFEDMRIPEGTFSDDHEHELIATAIFEWDLMEREYRIFNSFLKTLDPVNRDIFKIYIRREKRVADLASDLQIER